MCPRSSGNVPSLGHASAPQECPSLLPPAQIHLKCDLACVSKLVSELLIPFFAACALCIPLYTICLKDFFPGSRLRADQIVQSMLQLKLRHALRFRKMAKILEPVKLSSSCQAYTLGNESAELLKILRMTRKACASRALLWPILPFILTRSDLYNLFVSSGHIQADKLQ